jgi:CBS domain containing-hemolysin-like protein
LIFFVLGLIALLTGMEKKPQQSSAQPIIIHQPIQPPSQQVVAQQPINDSTKLEVTNRGKSMFDRDTFLGSIMAIGIGIVMLILIIWIEPLIKNIVDYQWILLVIRIAGVIFILIGVVGIIAALIPQKEYIQIEGETKK